MEIKVKLLVEKTHQGTEQQVYHETKEYRSLLERTATPIVLKKVHSPNLSPSALYRKTGSVYCRLRVESGGERLGEQTFCKTMGVAVHSTSDIYSLGETTEFCG